jgi:hypothetical protein
MDMPLASPSNALSNLPSGRRPTVIPTGRGLDILHRRGRCRRASTKASFVVIISTELVAEELPVWGTPSLQFPIQGRQPFAAKRTTYNQINVASTHIHRNPHESWRSAKHHSGISRKAAARIVGFQPKIASYQSRKNCRHQFAGLRSITFERKATGRRDPDAADRLAMLNIFASNQATAQCPRDESLRRGYLGVQLMAGALVAKHRTRRSGSGRRHRAG